MIKIFIIHYDKLFKRKIHISKQLNEYELDAEFISNYGKEKLTSDDKQHFTRISDSEISIFLHHLECYKKIVSENHDYALILEDDAILSDNFYNRLNKYIYDMPIDWDILYIGEGNLSVPKKIINKYRGLVNIFRKPADGFKYTDFYLIKNNACKKIIENFDNKTSPINIAVDHYLHSVINTCGLKALIGEPKLVSQGSINKKFASTIWHTKLNETDDINSLNPNYKLI